MIAKRWSSILRVGSDQPTMNESTTSAAEPFFQCDAAMCCRDTFLCWIHILVSSWSSLTTLDLHDMRTF